ncbi:MAG: HNH endonuclease [Acidobacteria bacterium]|nr:HNH endonuclease [Acidobacteriota bacterium]
MWRWDQGHLKYFQFDAIRQIASFVQNYDFRTADRPLLLAETGLDFAAPATHSPWRNYSRTLKLCLLVSENHGQAIPTPVAQILSTDGAVTCDEYFHFLASSFTSPSPAFRGWNNQEVFRYPLLFSLKYLLAKTAINAGSMATLDEILGAYQISGFTGDEGDEEFISLMGRTAEFEAASHGSDSPLRRQSCESLWVLAQISYLYIKSGLIFVSLEKEDAREIFQELAPILGPHDQDPNNEIRRISDLFRDGSTSISFEYPHTIVDDLTQSGFTEGGKIKKTHTIIERNAGLRQHYFNEHPTAVCDVCSVNTALSYPWAERILDLHHLLPLSSGTRVENDGTSFSDLRPVCPSCHRAIHRFYDKWLTGKSLKDFRNATEAFSVYTNMKSEFRGFIYA